MGKYDDRPYVVGKGKPPKEHQFPKGKSGNISGKGKPKPRKALREQLMKAGNQVVAVPTPRGTRKMTWNELGIALLYQDMHNGTPAERLRAFKELRAHGAFDTLPEDHGIPHDNVKKFIERLQEEAQRESLWQPGQSNPASPSKQ